MSSYSKTKSISKFLIYFSLLAILVSGGSHFLQKNQIGADTVQCGVPLFKQTDKDWGSTPYGCLDEKCKKPATIATSGCGPTSAAMVLKAWGKNVDPKITADYCLKNGHRINGEGTKASCLSGLASAYSMKIKKVGDKQTVKSWLSGGYPAIILVGPGTDKKYTAGGHYIVLTYLKGNTVSINDPNKNNTSDTFDNIYDKYKKDGFWFIYP